MDRLSRHVFDPELERALMARQLLAGAVIERAHDMLVGAKAVVVDHLRLAVAIDIEHLSDMGEAVPLRRILQRQHHHVVADDVRVLRVLAADGIVEIRQATANRRPELWRMAARIELVAAGIIERQRETEAPAVLHLGDALQHLLGRDEVEAPQLIVGTEIAPGGAGRSALPSRIFAHSVLPQKSCIKATRSCSGSGGPS